MRDFFLKTVSDSIKYNKALGVIVLIIFMLLLVFYKITFKKQEYQRLTGRVENIKMGYYLTERTSTVELEKEFVNRKGLEITLNNTYFYVDDNEKDKWSEIFQKVKINDTINIIYRHFVDNNMNNVYGLETKDEEILTTEERSRPLKYIQISIIFLIVTSLLFLFTLIKKRRGFVNLKSKKVT